MGRARRRQRALPAAAPPAPAAAAAPFPLWLVLALLALTAAAYWPMLQHEFTNWDDGAYVVRNELLRGPDWLGIFTQPVLSHYHPLTVLSLAVNYRVSGLDPWSYLLGNLLLHLLNTFLVFRFAWAISGREAWVALCTALVFALHPMHVESVAWVSERKGLLSACFFLVALLRYWRYLEDGRRFDYVLTFVFFLLALLAKAVAVILPVVLLLLDWWRSRTPGRALWLEKVPFFAVSLLFGVVTVRIVSQTAAAGLEEIPLSDRLLYGSYGLVAYLARFLWPWPLSALHPYPPPGQAGWAIRLAPFALLALAAVLWRLRREKAVLFGAAFSVVNVVLVVQFGAVGYTLLSERYTYVPYIGLAFALAMVARPHLASAPRWAAAGLLAAMLGAVTWARVQVWQNSETLWTDVLRHYPDAPVARANRASDLVEQATRATDPARARALTERALADCDAALASRPDHVGARTMRSAIHLQLGRPEAALADASALIARVPERAEAYRVRADALRLLKRYDEALADYEHVLARDPDDVAALKGRGAVHLYGTKDYAAAVASFDRALSLAPDAQIYFTRSQAHLMLGDLARARQDAETAARMGANVPAEYRAVLDGP